MRARVLIIGGDEALQALLERNGYACERARGPLRVRAVLESSSLDLIIWAEGAANASLAADLAAVWERFPGVPVVHVFPGRRGAPAEPVSPRIVEALPRERCEEALIGLLAGVEASLEGRLALNPVQDTELAFRNVLQTFRAHPAPGRPAPADEAAAARGAASTAVRPTERALLSGAAEPAGPARPRGTLRRLFGRGHESR